MSEKIRPAVKAVIEKNGELLVLKTEASKKIYYVLPGGKIEYGESHEEALKREIQEEISCRIDIGQIIGTYHFFTGPENDGDQVVLTVFDCEIGDQSIDITDNPADEGIIEYMWMKPEELMDKNENSSLRNLIREHFLD